MSQSSYFVPVCNGVSAAFALLAAGAWLKAANAPLPWFAWSGQTSSNEAPAANISEWQASWGANMGAQRGAIWNRRAALLAAAAAATQALALIGAIVDTNVH